MPKKDPLFDFDDSVDKLSEVSEKYVVDKDLKREFESVTKSEKAPIPPAPALPKPPTATATSGQRTRVRLVKKVQRPSGPVQPPSLMQRAQSTNLLP
jgi:hypothetical protein